MRASKARPGPVEAQLPRLQAGFNHSMVGHRLSASNAPSLLPPPRTHWPPPLPPPPRAAGDVTIMTSLQVSSLLFLWSAIALWLSVAFLPTILSGGADALSVALSPR